MRGHVYMRGGAECYVMRYLVAMISTLRSPLRVTLFSLTLIGLLSEMQSSILKIRSRKASLRRVVTSADMKAKDVDKATPRTLTPEQRVATWS